MTQLSTTILEIPQLQEIHPDPMAIRILDKENCENIQAIIYAKDKNVVKVLTTNNFPDKVIKLTKMLEDKGFKSELYYTSSEGFGYALSRYDNIIAGEQRLIEQQRAEKQAIGK